MLGDDARLDRAAAREPRRRDRRALRARHRSRRARGATSRPGMRQRVELIKCLRREPGDPHPRRADVGAHAGRERAAVRGVAGGGRPRAPGAVALVSHKLAEVLHATDEVTIMRHGRVVDRRPTAGRRPRRRWPGRWSAGRCRCATEAAALGAHATSVERGRHRDEPPRSTAGRRPGRAARSRGATRARATASRVLDGLDARGRAGEIVGVAGVEGNGQRELGDLLSSLITSTAARSRSTARPSHRPGRRDGARRRGRDPRGSPRLADACST